MTIADGVDVFMKVLNTRSYETPKETESTSAVFEDGETDESGGSSTENMKVDPEPTPVPIQRQSIWLYLEADPQSFNLNKNNNSKDKTYTLNLTTCLQKWLA